MDRRKFLAASLAAPLVLRTKSLLAASDFKVGLLVEGSVTEAGWARVAYEALLRIEKELGAEISYVELVTNPASFEKAFRDYAEKGYNVVIGHGFQFQDPALEVAPDYPDTTFFISSSNVFENNVVGVNLNNPQPFFVLGALAAGRGAKVGYVGGIEIPPISEGAAGFRNGARYIDPNIETLQTMTGSWTDIGAAKEAALLMIASGAKTLTFNAGVAGLGVLQAVAESGPEIGVFGTFGNYTEKAPKNVLANYMPNFGQGYVNILTQIRDKAFHPNKNIVFGLEAKDVIVISFNDGASYAFDAKSKETADNITAKLISGEIDPMKS